MRIRSVETTPPAAGAAIAPASQPAARVSELLSALSFALDLTEGQPMGHATRACILGMRMAREIGQSAGSQADLYYALLLKDAGCSSNASRMFHLLSADDVRGKRDAKLTDWTRLGWESLQYALGHVGTGAPFLARVRSLLRLAVNRKAGSLQLVTIRCERGASIAKQIGFPDPVAEAIYSLDEHWNGAGYPHGLSGKAIPLHSRILSLAQTMEVFFTHRGAVEALAVAKARAGRWFDPDLVKAAESLAKRGQLWTGIEAGQDTLREVMALEPEDRWALLTPERLDAICNAFAGVIDAKSPFTYRHSNGVAAAALDIGRQLGLPEGDLQFLHRAALLHDIGKLSVSNAILEKPGKLTNEEWQIVRQHPYYTYEVLRRISSFDQLSEVAAAHHEKLDGSGYFRGWTAQQLTLPMRILVVADIFDALHAKRPYRDALPLDEVFRIMQKDAPHAIDADCLEALMRAKGFSSLPGPPTADLLQLSDAVKPGRSTY
jgi:putative nucleotidyltransferase with HDIG domain